MSENFEIICFKHCDERSIFCREVPRSCPTCAEVITDFSHTPFQLPNPFSNGRDKPTSIIMKPSSGIFLDVSYRPVDDLHIGIVDSKRRIFEYDQRGFVFNDFTKWRHCISFDGLVPESWSEHWDNVLVDLSRSPQWKDSHYHPVEFNCFDFILEFIKKLGCKDFLYESKEHVCRDLILPKMKDALRYIAIYNSLRDANCYIR
ncbi:MKRN2 opposite strand protein [Diachasma alloeum]|uniref:MKRN2 opposite strand protein n=1 Tax=Diachasma alloeum TaxID=454923 RepID=UPI000738121A|nr:MKRN2 opposite strand protein [Diachasma alloeum]